MFYFKKLARNDQLKLQLMSCLVRVKHNFELKKNKWDILTFSEKCKSCIGIAGEWWTGLWIHCILCMHTWLTESRKGIFWPWDSTKIGWGWVPYVVAAVCVSQVTPFKRTNHYQRDHRLDPWEAGWLTAFFHQTLDRWPQFGWVSPSLGHRVVILLGRLVLLLSNLPSS